MDQDDNRQIILFYLKEAIRHTSAGDDLSCLAYNKENETVEVYFRQNQTPSRIINVAMDSEWAMIRDIVNHIDIG